MSTARNTRPPTPGRVSATEAAKNFGRLVDRVREEGISYIVDRGGTPVARIGPVERRSCTLADLRGLIESLPRADEEYLRSVQDVTGGRNRPHVRRNPWAR
jgi:prevent-host-death family protein